MLKKKNVFVAIISFLFCLSLFAGNVVIKNENVMQNSAHAEDIALPGDGASWSGEINSEDDSWWFDGIDTITLNGGSWTTPLYIPSDLSLTINIVGENTINTTETNAIVYNGTSLTFEGTGILSLTSSSNVFSFTSNNVATFTGMNVKSGDEAVDLNNSINTNSITISSVNYTANESDATITGEDKETTYDGSHYDLSSMFTYDKETADIITYSIEEGSTGEGVITGCTLEITKCGEFNIKISVDGTELTKVLTVNRANLPVGTGEGQTQIVLKGFDENDEEVAYTYLNGWDLGEFDYITASIINNVGNGDILDFSYYHYAYDGSAMMIFEGQDIPKDTQFYGGRYVIRAVIGESNLYEPVLLEKTFYVKSPIEYLVPQENVNIEYSDLDEGVFDLSSLFEVDENCLDSVDSISYNITSDVLNEPLNLSSPSFEITSINDDENGDDYLIEIIINAKQDGIYCSSDKFTINLNVKKSNVAGFDIQFTSKAYNGTPCEYEVVENVYNLSYSIEYLENETPLESAPIESGRYTAKVTVSGNEIFKETIIYREFWIGQTTIEIVWQEDDFTYNGEVQIISAYYVNHENEKVPLLVLTDKTFKDVQVGGVNYEYTACVAFDTYDERYTLPDSSVNQKTYHIKPMELGVRVLDRTKYYGTNVVPQLEAVTETGKIFIGDSKNPLWTLSVSEEINEETPVGSYEITATATNSNPNYNVTFLNTAYLKVKNVILTDDMISDWNWKEEPNTPYAEAAIGIVQFFYYKGEEQLSSPPRIPGEYRLIARVGESEDDINWAEKEELLIVDKIVVNIPNEDPNEYVYNGQLISYRVMDADLENASLYTIGERAFRDAGVHRVALTINDFEYYRWPNYQEVYYMNFEIKKKLVNKPAADNRVHKYNGNPITYMLATSEDYIISDNTTQSEFGRYRIVVSLVDTNNTVWSDGTTDNIVYDFVINQGRIDNPVITDADGNAINTKDATIIDVSGNGLNPESILKVEVANSGDEKIEKTKNQLNSVLSKYDKIFKVTDIKLVQYGVSVQPENRITLKMLVPEELRNANFTLYHIHTDESGNEIVSEIEYSKVDKDGYITFQTDKLSSFAFVYEQTSLKSSIVTFSVLSGIMFILLVVQVVLFILKKKSKAKVLAAAVPAFFVKSEVSATIALGCVFGVLLIANIVMLVFNIMAYKSKKCEEKKTQKKEKSKHAETKNA